MPNGRGQASRSYEPSFAEVLTGELALIRERRERIRHLAAEAPGDPPEQRHLAEVVQRYEGAIRALTAAQGDPTAPAAGNTDDDTRLTAIRRVAMDDHLAGLALSGGGIRSATFAVGVIQGLASLRILRFFDCLSTVSGGGYAGGWLAAWIAREGDPLNVERQLHANRTEQAQASRAYRRDERGEPDRRLPVGQALDDEPEPIRHLRQYSSYLNPRPGMFSVDTWTLLAIYARNVAINLMVLLPVLMALVVAVRIVIRLAQWEYVAGWLVHAELILIVVLAGTSLSFNAYLMWLTRWERNRADPGSRLLTWLFARWPWLWEAARLKPLGAPWILPASIRDWLFWDTEDSDAARSRRVQSVVPWGMSYAVVLPMMGAAVLAAFYYVPGLNLLREEFTDAAGKLRPWPVGVIGVLGLACLVILASEYRIGRKALRWLGLGLGLVTLSLLIASLGVLTMLTAIALLAGPLAGLTAAASSWYPGKDLLEITGVRAALVQGESLLAQSVENSHYLSLPNVLLHALAFSLVGAIVALCFFPHGRSRRHNTGMPVTAATIWAGAATGALMAIIEELLRSTSSGSTPWLLATIGPPLFFLAFLGGLALFAALLGTSAGENEREWWGRLMAKGMILSGCWAVAMGIVAFGPAVLYAAGSTTSSTLGVLWAVATGIGVRLSARAEAGENAGAGPGRTGPSLPTRIALAITPTLFLVGLLTAVAMLVAYLTGRDWNLLPDAPAYLSGSEEFVWYYRSYLANAARDADLSVLFLWLGGLAFVSFVTSWYVDSNLFSLHALYANRLTRTFLGASRPLRDWGQRWPLNPTGAAVTTGAPTDAQGIARHPNAFTGFDPDDEMDLYRLRIGEYTFDVAAENNNNTGSARRAGPPVPPPDVRYWGPHLIVNTALNLIAGDNLAWRDRKAESFALTPLYCGSRTTGYARVTEATARRLRLGRSIALSGAAVDPNMNPMQSVPMTVLLTVFNARLGAWVENPEPHWWTIPDPDNPNTKAWGSRGPTASYLLFRELLGDTRGRSQYVHLSDGGHFENLGVYELVRRRCRYIVAVDATENPYPTSDNLGILVRLCRIDFGVRIELDTEPLRLDGPEGRSRAHVVIGTIHYEDVDGGAVPGMLVYLRASMTGDEPPDVQQYRNQHPEFPRQLTLTDQSFDEDQFESYRALGEHVARIAFGDATRELYDEGINDDHAAADANAADDNVTRWWKRQGNGRDAFIDGHRRLFGAVRERWSETPTTNIPEYLESGREWSELQRDLRTDPNLARLSRELYPEIPDGADPQDDAVERAELHAIEQILQLMADAWVGQGLDTRRGADLSRGWLNTFRRLSGTSAFRHYWPTLRAEFNADFVRFCEKQLHAGVNPAVLVELLPDSPALAVLGTEFAREWPDHVRREAAALNLPRHGEAPLSEIGESYLRRLVDTETYLIPGTGRPGFRSAWLMVQSPAGHRPAEDDTLVYVRGLMIAHRHHRVAYPEAAELLVWIRPPFRSIGIGQDAWRVAWNRQWFQGWFDTLVARYPHVRTGMTSTQDRNRWLAFHTQFGFVPPPTRGLGEGQDWELVLKTR